MFISVEVGVPGTERKYCRRSEEGEVTIIWSVLGGLLGGGLVLGHENWEECGEGWRRGKEQTAKWVGRCRVFGTQERLWKLVSLREQVSGSFWV